jgi:threonine/homoserine/homoserine lactone efflux protein
MLPDLTRLGLFVIASLALLVTPGPAVLYIIARSIQQGRAAGLVSVLGIHLGTSVHVAAAALGLSALLMSSALAFAVVKYLGAAYLIWLGIRTLMANESEADAPAPSRAPLARIFRDGFVVNLLNPKTALFFLAFLPQFVTPALGGVHWQILGLGAIFMALGILSDGAYALAAGSLADWLRGNRRFQRFQRRFAGTAFIGLGLTAALAGRK